MESDADRLASIKGLGGQSFFIRGESFFGIFDNGFTQVVEFTETQIPAILCRSSDADRIRIAKDDVVDGLEKTYRVRRIEPDGTGMTRLALRL